MSNKVSIILPNKKFIADLYHWLFEDEIQESAKWNGPYYARPTTELTKEEYVNKPQAIEYVYQSIPKSMYIIHEGQFLGTVHANWVSEETNWMEIGIVIFNPDYWSGGMVLLHSSNGLIISLIIVIYIVSEFLHGQGMFV